MPDVSIEEVISKYRFESDLRNGIQVDQGVALRRATRMCRAEDVKLLVDSPKVLFGHSSNGKRAEDWAMFEMQLADREGRGDDARKYEWLHTWLMLRKAYIMASRKDFWQDIIQQVDSPASLLSCVKDYLDCVEAKNSLHNMDNWLVALMVKACELIDADSTCKTNPAMRTLVLEFFPHVQSVMKENSKLFDDERPVFVKFLGVACEIHELIRPDEVAGVMRARSDRARQAMDAMFRAGLFPVPTQPQDEGPGAFKGIAHRLD